MIIKMLVIIFHAGQLGVSIVIRSEDQNKIDNCNSQILKFVYAKKVRLWIDNALFCLW